MHCNLTIKNAILVLCINIIFLFTSTIAFCVEKTTSEKLKVALSINFIQYIQWPNEKNLDSFTIGIIDKDENIYNTFTVAAKKIKVKNKKLKVKLINDNSFQPENYQVIYIAKNKANKVKNIANKIRRSKTLLITYESPHNRDIMINIKSTKEGKMTFEINRSNIIFEKLKINKNILLLGGTELDVAELFRETENNLSTLKDQLHQKEASLKDLEENLSLNKQLLDKQKKHIKEQERQKKSYQEKLKTINTELLKKDQQLLLREQQLRNINNSIKKESTLLLGKQQEVEERQRTLKNQLTIFEERKKKLESLMTVISENDKILDQKSKEIESLSLLIKSNNEALKNQKKEINIKESELTEQSHTINTQKTWLILSLVGLILFTILTAIILRINHARNIAILQTEQAKEEAIQANNSKSLFLAKMSHEIRTPMSGVLGMTEILSDSGLTKEQKQYNDIIQASGRTLLAVINDILDYSKIEAGKMELEKISFRLDVLVQEVANMFRVRLYEKHLYMMTDISPDLPQRMIGDPTRIRQILTNLINNALKFTQKGEIKISIEADKEKNDIVKISVIDTGIGLSPECQNNLFTAFTQADSSTTRKYGGTGLGLTICKQLAELMEGGIGAHNNFRKGSTFWVNLKLPKDNKFQPGAIKIIKPVTEKITPRKILIIHDNGCYLNFLANIAKRNGFTVDCFQCSEQAMQTLESVKNHDSYYNLIICNHEGHLNNSIKLMEVINKSKFLSLIPFILFSECLVTPERTKLKEELKLKSVVNYPFTETEFIDIIKDNFVDTQCINRPPKEADDKSAKAFEPIGKPLNILVVEDTPVVRQVMAAMLKKFNQEATFAEDGLQALQLVKNSKHNYDIIFMDCEMPNMDGMTASKEIRNWEASVKMPRTRIVALTAHVLREQIDRCKESGMDDFMVKPIDQHRLHSALLHIAHEKNHRKAASA